MSDPVESRPALPLYQVLVEELSHQYPDPPPITLAEIEAKRALYEAELDQEHRVEAEPGKAPAEETPETREERKRTVDLRLVREVYRRLHERQVERTALCFSGGGIRSATFGLGIVQGLCRLGLLGKFDFLSTVSGGGYLGSWLTGWIQREKKGQGGLAEVQRQLASAPAFPLTPEPEPVHHLREYSRYMSPKLGLLSADTWTLVAIFFRNLILNWLVLLPLLASFLMIPRISILLARQQPLHWWWLPPLVFWIGFALGVVGIAYIAINRPSLTDRPALFKFPARFRGQGWFLVFCLAPLALMSIAVSLYWAWVPIPVERLRFDVLGAHHVRPLVAFVLFGAVLHVCGYLLARLFVRASWKEIVGVLVSGAIGGFAAWLAATRLFPVVRGWWEVEDYVCFSAPLLLFLFLVAATLFVGLASKLTDDQDREWLARGGAWILIFIVLRSAVALLVIYGPIAWHFLGATLMTAVGGASGVATLLLGHSSKTGATERKRGEPKSTTEIATNIGLAVAAPLFALSILVGLAFGTTLLIRLLAAPLGKLLRLVPGLHLTRLLAPDFTWPLGFCLRHDPYEHLSTLYHSPGVVIVAVSLALIAVGLLMGTFIDINRFSLHGAYRDRLIRAYLGASRVDGTRRPNPFTGFDDDDNLELRKIDARRKPFHVVNTALNLVAGKELAWQDRKAASFTFSPLHCGSTLLGYRSAERYGYHQGEHKAITLGTAVAISGAAASPNMGYHSSPVITFLLALWNIRLGWWLGNPGPAGEKTYAKPGPVFAPKALLAEAFGMTDDEHKYVYLSDGGHFENLGIYEMVLRRCRYIVVSDGGADPNFDFEDLGNALSKIRIDLGVPIEFERLPMHARDDLDERTYDRDLSQAAFPYCALARIRYSCVDYLVKPGDLGEEIDGCLLYIKASLNGTEPADVFHYAKLHSTFPHESTGNQLYSEAQFESYRELGSHVMDCIGGDKRLAALSDLFAQAAAYAGGRNPCERTKPEEKGPAEAPPAQ